jgi:hypothetical protein
LDKGWALYLNVNKEIYMSEEKPKWNLERVHEEIYQARTKLFVVQKVLETGSVPLEDSPEWVLVIKPLLKEAKEIAEAIDGIMKEEYISETGSE